MQHLAHLLQYLHTQYSQAESMSLLVFLKRDLLMLIKIEAFMKENSPQLTTIANKATSLLENTHTQLQLGTTSLHHEDLPYNRKHFLQATLELKT